MLIGMPVGARQHGGKALEELIGFFVNTVAIRMNFGALTAAKKAPLSFSEVLQEVDLRVSAAMEHAEVPWQLLVNSMHYLGTC